VEPSRDDPLVTTVINTTNESSNVNPKAQPGTEMTTEPECFIEVTHIVEERTGYRVSKMHLYYTG
jgi:hypothetical protein